MDIMERITGEMKEAMKNKDQARLSALRMLRSELVKKMKEKGDESLSTESAVSVIQSLIRRYRESIEEFKKAGREDLASEESAQLRIIESYLPEKVSDEEIQQAIDKAIQETGAMGQRDFGRVMGRVMSQLKETGKVVDGKEVSEKVRSALARLEES